MIAKSSWSFLIMTIASIKVNAASLDKNSWKPISRFRGNSRQYHSSANAYTPTSSSHSQAYSGSKQSYMARPVTYVPPALTFNPPRLVYGSPSVTKAVPPSSSQYYRQNYAPSSTQSYGGLAQSTSYAHPSYAAPVQPHQYKLVNPMPAPQSPISFNPIAYQFTPQQTLTTPAPSRMQYQLISEASSMARNYAPPPQYQLIQEPSVNALSIPALYNPYIVTTAVPTSTPPPTSTTEATTTPVPPTASPTASPDNATFVDVVTVMAKYFRATGTQLTEMFTQLNNNTELNAWGYGWTTSTTTTTPAPPPPPPSYQPPVVVVQPIMMPSAPPPPQPTYSIMPPPPPPPPQQYPPPQTLYYQPQPSFSHLQPTFAQPPPLYSQTSFHQPTPSLQQPPPPTYFRHLPPPLYPQEKNVNMEIMDNSIDHDYYYDCDKK